MATEKREGERRGSLAEVFQVLKNGAHMMGNRDGTYIYVYSLYQTDSDAMKAERELRAMGYNPRREDGRKLFLGAEFSLEEIERTRQETPFVPVQKILKPSDTEKNDDI